MAGAHYKEITEHAGFKNSGLICYLALFENIPRSGVSLTKTDASVDRVHYEPRWNKEIR